MVTATKTSLKSEVALLQTLSHLFHLVKFVRCWQFLLELNSKRLYRSSGKEKESLCLVFTSSSKREIRYFHIVCSRAVTAHAESLFCQSKPIAFLLFSLMSPLSLLTFKE